MGLFKTAAKVAVASHVHGKVKRRQSLRWAEQDAARGNVGPAAPTSSSSTGPSPTSTAPPAPPVPVPHPASPVAPATVGPPVADVLTQLAKLGELRAAGVLTDAEFETQKARILAQ